MLHIARVPEQPQIQGAIVFAAIAVQRGHSSCKASLDLNDVL